MSIASLFWLLLGDVWAENSVSLEDIRPVQKSNLPDFRKNRRVFGPYYFVGYAQQLQPISGISAISISHQLQRSNQRTSFEFGLRLSQMNPESGITYENRNDMFLNDDKEYVQNVFLGSVDVFHVCHFLQPSTSWSLQSYLGTGIHISRHVYYLSDDEKFLAMRWKGFSSMPSHLTRLPEIPLQIGIGGQIKITENYGMRLRYLHSFTYKKTPEPSLNVEPTTRDIYQYAMILLDVFFAKQ